MMPVCSTEFVFHALFNLRDGLIESILKNGLRPLSDFPDSERWRRIETHMPGWFEKLYREFAQPVIQRPYLNSGVFVSPIDFRLLPDSLMHNKARVKIPVSRIDPDYAALTYVLNDQRVVLRLTAQNLQDTSALWTAPMVTEWFGKDDSKLFFYVPQIAVYQPEGIHVEPTDIEQFA